MIKVQTDHKALPGEKAIDPWGFVKAIPAGIERRIDHLAIVHDRGDTNMRINRTRPARTGLCRSFGVP